MSLLHARLALPAIAAVAAIAGPFLLLRQGEAPPRSASARIAPPPPEVTPVPPGSLSFALTAPPFDTDRTPGTAPPPPPAAAAAPPPPPPPAPRLVGVAAGGRSRAVALVRGADGETKVLSRGQSIDGWRLVAIGRQEAAFELNGERRTIRLDFGNKSSGAPAPRPGPFPSAAAPSARPSEIPPPPPARLP